MQEVIRSLVERIRILTRREAEIKEELDSLHKEIITIIEDTPIAEQEALFEFIASL